MHEIASTASKVGPLFGGHSRPICSSQTRNFTLLTSFGLTMLSGHVHPP